MKTILDVCGVIFIVLLIIGTFSAFYVKGFEDGRKK